MADREEYESTTPLTPAEILDAIGDLSQEAAGHEADEEGLKGKASDAKKAAQASIKKLRDLAAAHKQGKPVYALTDGTFTTEEPDRQLSLTG